VGVLAPLNAFATDHVLINDYSPYGVSDIVDINLNSYSVTTVTELYLSGLGDASNQGGTLTWAYSDCEVSDSSNLLSSDYCYSEGAGDANAGTEVDAYSLTKNGAGHWIASYVEFGNKAEQYNVDFGTGALVLEIDAGNGGDEGGGQAYAMVNY